MPAKDRIIPPPSGKVWQKGDSGTWFAMVTIKTRLYKDTFLAEQDAKDWYEDAIRYPFGDPRHFEAFMESKKRKRMEQKKWEAVVRETKLGRQWKDDKKYTAEIKVGGKKLCGRQFTTKRQAEGWLKLTMEACKEEEDRINEEEMARKGREEEMQKQKDNKNKTKKKKRPPADRGEEVARKKIRVGAEVTV
jgi:hypothetical protein